MKGPASRGTTDRVSLAVSNAQYPAVSADAIIADTVLQLGALVVGRRGIHTRTYVDGGHAEH